MLPIFGVRSIMAIFIGLIVGLVAGWGYMSLSNSNAVLNSGWPPIQIEGGANAVPYETTIQGRILPGSNDETFIRTMDAQGQYYAAKMDSLPFFKYFHDAIANQYPQYAQTPEKLAKMITVKYVTLADNPSVIEITVGAASSEETLFLIQNLPGVFENYLQAEQNNLQSEAYQVKLKQIESTRNALLQAGKDLASAAIPEETAATMLSPDYIELSAKITSLETELKNQADQASILLAQGTTGTAPVATPLTPVYTAPQDTTPAVLAARIKGLEEALTLKAWQAAGFTVAAGSSGSNLPDMLVLSQAIRDTNAHIYTNTVAAMERTSTELSKAKVEMNKLQTQVSQEKAAKEGANAQKNLAFNLANAQIASLTEQLDSQTKEIQAMSQTVTSAVTPKFYAVTTPQTPVPASSSKNAPIAGAVIGMLGGWAIVNRRWLAGSSSQASNFSAKDVESRTVPGSHENQLSERKIEAKTDYIGMKENLNATPEGTKRKE